MNTYSKPISKMTKSEYLDLIPHYGGRVTESCEYCGGKNHPYMVQFSLWKKVVSEEVSKKLVCILCFEQKLGRKLMRSDFIKRNRHGIPLPINNGKFGFDANIYCSLK